MEKTEQLTNEYIAKELSRLREIRERLENEYEYMAFSCRHGIGDVEANKAEAHRLGRILGRRAVIIERELSDDTKRKNNDTKCKNPKNQDALKYIEQIRDTLITSDAEVGTFVIGVVFNDNNIATGSIGSLMPLARTIGFLIRDLENHSSGKPYILPIVKTSYEEFKKMENIKKEDVSNGAD